MARKVQLDALKLLIVDPDVQLAQVCAQGLRGMGFGRVEQVRDAVQAFESLKSEPADILITEAVLPSSSGVEFTQSLRKADAIPQRLMSIIMLTAKAELDDVKAARDAGVNEFMVKPFTAKTLYARLEQVIETPRPFVLSQNFTGPDRRRRAADAPGGNKRKSGPVLKEKEKMREPDPVVPVALRPDYLLKQKIGLDGKLSDIITPEILAEAQQEIDSFKDQSQTILADDIQELLDNQKALVAGISPDRTQVMQDICLSLKGRAGMFGHSIVSDVAQLFYGFLRNEYRAGYQPHHLIIQKYSEALYAAFASDMTTRDIRVGEALVQDLKRLTMKFKEA